MAGAEVFVVNIMNIIIALFLFMVSFKTYKSYKLKIFKNAWFLVVIGSLLWLLGHVIMLLDSKVGFIHYTLFTLFIILLTIALYSLAKTAKTLGV